MNPHPELGMRDVDLSKQALSQLCALQSTDPAKDVEIIQQNYDDEKYASWIEFFRNEGAGYPTSINTGCTNYKPLNIQESIELIIRNNHKARAQEAFDTLQSMQTGNPDEVVEKFYKHYRTGNCIPQDIGISSAVLLVKTTRKSCFLFPTYRSLTIGEYLEPIVRNAYERVKSSPRLNLTLD